MATTAPALSTSPVCRTFMRTGACPIQDFCIYSHPSPVYYPYSWEHAYYGAPAVPQMMPYDPRLIEQYYMGMPPAPPVSQPAYRETTPEEQNYILSLTKNSSPNSKPAKTDSVAAVREPPVRKSSPRKKLPKPEQGKQRWVKKRNP